MNAMVETRLVPDCRRAILRQQFLQSMRPQGAENHCQCAGRRRDPDGGHLGQAQAHGFKSSVMTANYSRAMSLAATPIPAPGRPVTFSQNIARPVTVRSRCQEGYQTRL